MVLMTFNKGLPVLDFTMTQLTHNIHYVKIDLEELSSPL